MEQASNAMTLLFGIALVTVLGLELQRKRKQLRELYGILDAEDNKVLGELYALVDNGHLKPWTSGVAA
jgi:hypothetical protein